MPIYEYQCQACQHRVEVIQKVSDPALIDCEACGKPALLKQISRASFQLKGTGWYVTDFKNNDKKPATSNKEQGSSAQQEATSAKSDAAAKTGGDQSAA